MASGTPPQECEITVELAHRLICDQFPQYSREAVCEAASGWDNIMFRLGDHLAMRIPRRQVGADLLANEHKHLSQIKDFLVLPAPIPVHKGQPTDYFPWHWSVVPWLEGEPADLNPPLPNQVSALANFLHCLHQPAPADFPHNPFRGIPLVDRAQHFADALPHIQDSFTDHHFKMWDQAMEVTPHQPDHIIHGDLHPQNVLTHNGKISAIIDWGDICAGDPANDYLSFYLLFDDPNAIFEATSDPHLIAGARGWALLFIALVFRYDSEKVSRHAITSMKALETLGKAPLMP